MRCPVCRASDNKDPQCRRCKADLTLLWNLERAREQLLAKAARAAAGSDGMASWRYASQAHELQIGADSCKALAVAYLLCRDFAQARRWHARAIAAMV
jgi:hypothetical protein